MILFLEAYQLELGTIGPMVSAGGLLPGYLTWDSFGPHHLSALTAATEAKGQEPQKVFRKKIASEMLIFLFLLSVLHVSVFLGLVSHSPFFFHK